MYLTLEITSARAELGSWTERAGHGQPGTSERLHFQVCMHDRGMLSLKTGEVFVNPARGFLQKNSVKIGAALSVFCSDYVVDLESHLKYVPLFDPRMGKMN